jgi:hypothetical protein
MKAKIENGKLTIDLQELVDSLDEAQRIELSRHLVADAELFRAVLECVAEGQYFTDDDRGAWWFGRAKVLELRAKLMPLMPEVAREAVRAALDERRSAEAERDRYRRWSFAMHNEWPEWRTRPEGPPEWEPTPAVSDADVDAHMAAHAAGREGAGGR